MDDKQDKAGPGTLPGLRGDRRAVLGKGAAAIGAVMAAPLLNAVSARAAGGRIGTAARPFTVCGAGEFMSSRRLNGTAAPFRAVVGRMQKADLTYAHCEMNFGTPQELPYTPRGTAGVASYMNADPVIVKDLADIGIDAMSLAMNHSFDWGAAGLESTARHMADNGIAHAGTGRNLMAARQPAFFDVDGMRCSLVSAASGNNAYEWAGLPLGDIDGRPGVNPIRVRTRYVVDKASAAELKRIGKGLGVLNDKAAARSTFNITPGGGAGGTGTADFAFEEGDAFAIRSMAHPGDVEANVRAVQWARSMSDFVMFAHHNSTSEGSRGTGPSGFAVDVAHAVIDAGADVFWGHGWHVFLGIEIYKGKPIVYGMGNFVYGNVHLTRIPADSFESYGKDLNNLGALTPQGDMHPGGGAEDWSWTALYEMDWVGGRLRQIRLYPVELGMDFTGGKGVINRAVGGDGIIDGTPYLATGANAQAILRRLQERNAMRGTAMTIRGDVGIIDVPA
ncbi:CapA family protein [Novosphingobium resinovorum]|uniref:CapA family protein n=1 Tax=Novosphingobium resinovorum TaxID=158500 RepID=UPI002ED1809F|nr:CapA family protein [Novosphingobium resinovorum]